MRRILLTLLVLSSTLGISSAQCDLQTLFRVGAGGARGNGLFFDLTVNRPVEIQELDINTFANGTPVGLSVYLHASTHIGNTQSSAGWTLVGTDDGTATGAGIDNPTRVRLAAPFILVPGSYGIAVVGNGPGGITDLRYTHLGAITTYSNAFLSLTAGTAMNVPFSGSSVFFPRIWNGAIHCTPAAGLVARFSASPSTGSSPLGVQFTDQSFTDDPAGVTSWAWDLDGDGAVDSTLQHPRFTYTRCGLYDVTLTVTDNTNGSASWTREEWIEVDPNLIPGASFTSNVQGGNCPLTVNFQDTSTGSPSNWFWDLDGDGSIDSTQPQPSFTYTVPGCYDVTLTVSNACSQDTRTETAFVCCYQNDDCANALPLALGRHGPFVNTGATNSLPLWSCAPGGSDLWFQFTPSCTGVYVFSTCPYQDFDTVLELFEGTCGNLSLLQCNDDFCALNSQVQARLDAGTTFTLRVGGYAGRMGTFEIDILRTSGSGTFQNVTAGCGTPVLQTSGNPDLGTTFTFSIELGTGTPLLWFGSAFLNAALCPGSTCVLGTELGLVLPLSSVTGTLPCDPALIGASFYTQAADLGAPLGCPASTFGVPFAMTNTIRTTVGQ